MSAGGNTRSARSWLPWLGLGVALSPTLAELAEHLYYEHTDRYALLAPLLVLYCLARRLGAAGPGRGAGLALLGLALVLQLVGIVGHSWSIARLAVPCAAFGLALWLGRPPTVVVLLLFAMIPIPQFVLNLPSPGLESLWARAATGALAGLGVEISSVGPSLRTPEAHLTLDSTDSGLRLLVVLAAVGWFRGVVRGAGFARAALHAIGFALFAPLAQIAAVLVAGLLLANFSRGTALEWLVSGAWILTAGLALLLARRPRRGREPST